MADLDLKVQLSLQDKATKDLKRFNAELAKTKKQLLEVSKMKAKLDMGSSGGTRPSGGTSTSGGAATGGALAGAGALLGGASVSAAAGAGALALTKIIAGLGGQVIAASSAIQAMNLSMGLLFAEIATGTPPMAALRKEAGTLFGVVDQGAKQGIANRKRFRELTDELERNTKAVIDNGTAAGKSAKKQKSAGNAAEKTGRQVKKNFLTVERSLPTYVKWGGALAIAAGAFKLLSSAIRVGSEYEQLRAQLQGVITDAEDVGEAFEFIKGVSSQLPTTIAQTTAAFIKMRALGIIPTEERMLAFGNIAATFGADILDVAESAARATVFEFERLEAFGIKYKQQGDNVLFTFQNVTKSVKKNSTDIIGYLEEIGKTNLVGAAALQMDTLVGKTTNLADAWDELLDAFAKSGLNDFVKSAVVGLTAVVKDFDNLGNIASRVSLMIAAGMGETAIRVKHAFTAALPLIGAAFTDLFSQIADGWGRTINGLLEEYNNMLDYFDIDAKIDITPVVTAKSEWAKTSKELSAAQAKELAAFNDQVDAWNNAIPTQGALKKSTSEYNDLLHKLDKTTQDKIKSDEAAKLAQDALSKAMAAGKNITKDMRTNIEVYHDTVAELNKLLSQTAISQETFNRALKSAKDEASGGLFADTRTDAENTNAYFDELVDLLNNGVIGWDTYGRAVENRLEEMKDKSKDTAKTMQSYFVDAAREMEGGFSDFFFDVMQGNMTDLVGNFKKTLDRMVADMLASQVAGALFGNYQQSGSVGGLAGQAGTFLSGLLARETGGYVPAGTPTLVGEKRPEIIVPSTDSFVYPSVDSFKGSQSGGGDTYSISVNALDSKSFRDMVEQDERWFVDTLSGTSRRLNKGGA